VFVDGRWSVNDFRDVKDLISLGFSDYQIAKCTRVPRGTVQRWRHRELPPYSAVPSIDASSWRDPEPAAYCYLLGCYLGDGHVTYKPPRTWTLKISCDRNYTAIIDEVRNTMEVTFPGRRSTRIQASTGAAEVVSICHPGVGTAFPQHGPGRKHARRIVLAEWQERLTHAHPGALIRGLIHSDGCRAENRFRTKLPSGRVAEYSYTRYFFSNLSADIRQIFIEHCELLAIRVTQSNPRNLSVSHRDSVAILERVVGPKR
jgi:hypothetical protein